MKTATILLCVMAIGWALQAVATTTLTVILPPGAGEPGRFASDEIHRAARERGISIANDATASGDVTRIVLSVGAGAPNHDSTFAELDGHNSLDGRRPPSGHRAPRWQRHLGRVHQVGNQVGDLLRRQRLEQTLRHERLR